MDLYKLINEAIKSNRYHPDNAFSRSYCQHIWSWLIVAVLLFNQPCFAEPQTPDSIKNLKHCYLQVALKKTTADMIYLAKGICDEIYKPKPRVVIRFDNKNKRCKELWFDANGRYEENKMLCALEAQGPQRWTFSCEGKNKNKKFTLIEPQEQGDLFRRQSTVIGYDPGPLFKTLAACILHKAKANKN